MVEVKGLGKELREGLDTAYAALESQGQGQWWEFIQGRDQDTRDTASALEKGGVMGLSTD